MESKNILPITPAMTGPWFKPILSRKRWKLSRFIVSSVCIKAIAKSTSITTLCSSVLLASCGNESKKKNFVNPVPLEWFKISVAWRNNNVEFIKIWCARHLFTWWSWIFKWEQLHTILSTQKSLNHKNRWRMWKWWKINSPKKWYAIKYSWGKWNSDGYATYRLIVLLYK